MRVLTVVALLFCLGCAGAPPAPSPLPAVKLEPPLLRLLGPLGADDPECRMVRKAREDSAHVWVWAELRLADGDRVRIVGPGSVEALRADGSAVPDLGLCVRLRDDRDAYLNSSAGPITIRHGHGQGGRVRFLVRLPAEAGPPEALAALRPVPGRWSLRRAAR